MFNDLYKRLYSEFKTLNEGYKRKWIIMETNL